MKGHRCEIECAHEEGSSGHLAHSREHTRSPRHPDPARDETRHNQPLCGDGEEEGSREAPPDEVLRLSQVRTSRVGEDRR